MVGAAAKRKPQHRLGRGDVPEGQSMTRFIKIGYPWAHPALASGTFLLHFNT